MTLVPDNQELSLATMNESVTMNRANSKKDAGTFPDLLADVTHFGIVSTTRQSDPVKGFPRPH